MLLDELVIVWKACLRGGTHHELPVLYKSRSAGLLCWDCADSAARVKPGHCSPFAPDDSLSLPHHSVFSHLIRLFSPWLPLEDLRHLCPRLLIFPPLHVNSVWLFSSLFIHLGVQWRSSSGRLTEPAWEQRPWALQDGEHSVWHAICLTLTYLL